MEKNTNLRCLFASTLAIASFVTSTPLSAQVSFGAWNAIDQSPLVGFPVDLPYSSLFQQGVDFNSLLNTSK